MTGNESDIFKILKFIRNDLSYVKNNTDKLIEKMSQFEPIWRRCKCNFGTTDNKWPEEGQNVKKKNHQKHQHKTGLPFKHGKLMMDSNSDDSDLGYRSLQSSGYYGGEERKDAISLRKNRQHQPFPTHTPNIDAWNQHSQQVIKKANKRRRKKLPRSNNLLPENGVDILYEKDKSIPNTAQKSSKSAIDTQLPRFQLILTDNRHRVNNANDDVEMCDSWFDKNDKVDDTKLIEDTINAFEAVGELVFATESENEWDGNAISNSKYEFGSNTISNSEYECDRNVTSNSEYEWDGNTISNNFSLSDDQSQYDYILGAQGTRNAQIKTRRVARRGRLPTNNFGVSVHRMDGKSHNSTDTRYAEITQKENRVAKRDIGVELNLKDLGISDRTETEEGTQIPIAVDHNETTMSSINATLTDYVKEFQLRLSPVVEKTVIEALHSNYYSPQDGKDTMIVLDISDSMDGKGFQQAISTLLNILHYFETVLEETGIAENVGIVVFGKETKILHHLSVDFTQMYGKIENLRAGGTSPLCLALLLAHIELNKRGISVQVGTYSIASRIIIMTDGRPTEDEYFNDLALEVKSKNAMVRDRVLHAMDVLRKHSYNIFCIPIGTVVNRPFVEDMASHGGGEIFEQNDTNLLKKFGMIEDLIGRIISTCQDIGPEVDHQRFLEENITIHNERVSTELRFNDTDKAFIYHKLLSLEELDDAEYIDLGLPPLGSRIESLYPLQNFGTVVNHTSKGVIKIVWDNGKINDCHFLEEVGKSISLNERPRKVSHNSIVQLGVSVTLSQVGKDVDKRLGRGRVFHITDSGYVKVRWSNETVGFHKCGADGEFEIIINDDDDSGMITSYFSDGVWQWQDDNNEWVDYTREESSKIEAHRRGGKSSVLLDTGRRLSFIHMKDKGHPVRRQARQASGAY